MDNHNDAIRDIAIAITNKLIELGYVPDCTDTDDESEFEVQDTIVEVLELSIPLGTFGDDETDEDKQELVDKCIEEIKNDVRNGDLTAIDGMLILVPTKVLKDFLPEDLSK